MGRKNKVRIRNFSLGIILFILGIGVVFATNNFFKIGENWDANVDNTYYTNGNDIFTLSGRLDLEDSRSSEYESGYRGKIIGSINSELFGIFDIEDKIELKENSSIGQYGPHLECGTSDNVERYSMSGSIKSNFWGVMTLENSSYFCSNQYTYIKLKSDSLGEKEVGTGSTNPQGNLVDDFGKQEIAISGIVKIKGETGTGILNRGDGVINTVSASISSKTIAKTNVSKNIAKLFFTYKDKIIYNTFTLNELDGNIENNGEKYYLYDYSSGEENIKFSGNNYINKGKNLRINVTGSDKIEIDGKHTVIVKGGNVYINSDLYNKNDKNSILTIVAKKDKKTGNGGNIYIDSDVTNIDAILIADGSLISIDSDSSGDYNILSAKNDVDNLRKQLLIYGSVLTSNSIGSDEIPYGADYYQHSDYEDNSMTGSIYDLGNLRTFNVNYGSGYLAGVDLSTKLVPINSSGYLEKAWAGRCELLNGVNCDSYLRKSTKRNPVIIEYNSNIQELSPYILLKN